MQIGLQIEVTISCRRLTLYSTATCTLNDLTRLERPQVDRVGFMTTTPRHKTYRVDRSHFVSIFCTP